MSTFDPKKAEAFAGRLMGALNEGAFCLMASIGHRTGLFDAMRDQAPGCTCVSLSQACAQLHSVAMSTNASVRFFDEQFRRQLAAGDHQLNPFEAAALPHIRGKVLDYGCGLGNLSVAVARQGCTVVALDGSHAAIEHLRLIANRDELQIQAEEADLRTYEFSDDFDTVVCIGLLMFFDCPTAFHQFSSLQDHVRPGGVLVVNVLTEGTTYMDMFSAEGHCLFKPGYLRECLAGWELINYVQQEFDAPRNTVKTFETAIARNPGPSYPAVAR